MLSYIYWIFGYGDIETPEEIIEKIKEKEIEIRSKEILYSNVVVELKTKLIPKDY